MVAEFPPDNARSAIEIEGNRIALLAGGPERLEALLALIASAKHDLRLLYYMFKSDASGHRVRDALLEARLRGVTISILIDGFGSEDVQDDFFKPLLDAECRFCRFEPRWGRRYLLRNHQKFALADSDRVIAGGFNIGDDYFGGMDEQAWRDLGFQLDGPAAACLVSYFDQLFDWGRRTERQFRSLRRLLEGHSQHHGAVRWLFGGPTRRLSPWTRAIKADLTHASRLDIIAAYFAPNLAMLRRIGAVARRGAARLVIAAKSDNGATIGAARHTYARLLRHGVEIYEYQPTKLHTKLIILDDVVHIGSSNFDMRSLYLNLEVMLRIEDPRFAEMLRGYVEGEVADSERVSAVVHRRQRTLFNRLKWALCYFVVATTDYTVTRRLNFGVRAP